MNYNYELSQKLKEIYKHELGECYNNAYELLLYGEVEYYSIGYVHDLKTKVAIRHAWGVLNNQIIDTTVGNIDMSDYNFYSAFNIYKNDLEYIRKNYKPCLEGYKDKEEQQLLEMLIKDKKVTEVV
ncbi:hypothetical protein CDFC105_72936 [Clostridioides difficile]|nr:hypothetical protein CDFC105_64157 [Clostridioides difficile]CZS08865.1 hypothetical protein CDFC105_72936 [Clostridioides difficile]